jgi:cell division protein FtsB
LRLELDEKWQSLHRRVALGESLTSEERAAYDSGCQVLDSGEHLDGDLERIRQLKASIAEDEEYRRQLRQRETELEERIAALEARLDEKTRHLLGITG